MSDWIRFPGPLSVPYVRGSSLLVSRYYIERESTGISLAIQHGNPRVLEDPVNVYRGKSISEIRISIIPCSCLRHCVRKFLAVVRFYKRIGNAKNWTFISEYEQVFSFDENTEQISPIATTPTCHCSREDYPDVLDVIPNLAAELATLSESFQESCCDEIDPDPEPDPQPPLSITCPPDTYSEQNCIGRGFWEVWRTEEEGTVFAGSCGYTPASLTTHGIQADEGGRVDCGPTRFFFGDQTIRSPVFVLVPIDVILQGDTAIVAYCNAECCAGRGSSPNPIERVDRTITDETDPTRCNLFLVLSISAGIKFTWEVETPGQESSSQEVIEWEAWTYNFEVDLPISLTNAELHYLSIFNPSLELSLDFTGITLSWGISLQVLGVPIPGASYSGTATLLWAVIFPHLAPVLLRLSALPVSPFADLKLKAIKRRNC